MRGYIKLIGLCAVLLTTPVTGITFTSTNPRYVIGESGTLALRCSVTESDATTVYTIKIKRVVSPGSITDELLADLKTGTAQLNDQISNDRDFAVEGSLSDSPPYLQISMNIQKMTCNDARMYKCEAGYDSSTTGEIETPKQNITLQAFVKPTMTSLIGTKNSNFISGGTSISDKAQFDAGDILELSCKAKIGSFEATKIRWRKTSETGSGYIGYQPAAGAFTEGTALSDNQCGYDRTATITYNTTNSDASYDLAFECYVSVSGYPLSSSTPGGSYTTTNNLQYHLGVTSSTDDNTGGVASAGTGGSSTGAIIGGVIGGLLAIIIIVVVVWFLWFRRKDGETCFEGDCSRCDEANSMDPDEPAGSMLVTNALDTTKEEYGFTGNIRKHCRPFKISDSRHVKTYLVRFVTSMDPDEIIWIHAGRKRTRSENPNMAPPPDMYATVDKPKKRGQENRGLDEPHETRRHHYANGPGKANYGMDRDADDYDQHYDRDYDRDDRDGSPTMGNERGISHMGMDPMDGRIGTGV